MIRAIFRSSRTTACCGPVEPIRLFSSEGSDRPKRPVSERGQESHGAMKSYFQQNTFSGDAGGNNPWGDMIGSVKATNPKADSISGPDYNSSNRSFNRRVTAGKKNKKGPAGVAGVGGAAGRFEGSVGMANVFGRKADGFDEDDENTQDDGEIPPEVIPYLYDTPFFEEKVAQGMSMNYGNMDPIDKFFADAFMESFRHKNHEVSYALADTGLNRIRLPKPRPTRDLVASLIPDITSVSRDEDPEAYKLGGDAWLAISKNIYFSDQEKSYICNEIAKRAHKLNKGVVELARTGEADEYRIFSRDFHRGYEGLTPEQRREIFGYEDDDIDQDIEAIATFADGEDITDYDVEAFVDEDQLFE